MGRCVVIGGAAIADYETVKQYLHEDDFYICCDSGMKHREKLGIEPHLIVGDFDSWKLNSGGNIRKAVLNAELNYFQSGNVPTENEIESGIPGTEAVPDPSMDKALRAPAEKEGPEILTLPADKYDSDSAYGIREGIHRGFDEFLLVGVIGQRMDHSLANLYLLVMLDACGKHGMIIDDYSEMELISGRPAYVEDRFPYFSLLNITGTARRITIENARYCYLPGEEISCEYQYGISNEVLPGKTAKITVGEGKLLLIRNR